MKHAEFKTLANYAHGYGWYLKPITGPNDPACTPSHFLGRNIEGGIAEVDSRDLAADHNQHQVKDRPRGKERQVAVRLEDELIARIDGCATDKRVKRATWIRDRLWEYFDAQDLAALKAGAKNEAARMAAGR